MLSEAEGFQQLPDIQIGILRGHTTQHDVVDALARHIAESLDNISVPPVDPAGTFDFEALPFQRVRKQKAKVAAGW